MIIGNPTDDQLFTMAKLSCGIAVVLAVMAIYLMWFSDYKNAGWATIGLGLFMNWVQSSCQKRLKL